MIYIFLKLIVIWVKMAKIMTLRYILKKFSKQVTINLNGDKLFKKIFELCLMGLYIIPVK